MMGTAYVKRRDDSLGIIICDNETARLRVVRLASSLGLAFDAYNADGQWESILHAPTEADFLLVGATGEDVPYQYFAFDPVLVQGRTRGVTLYGCLGSEKFSLTALLSDEGNWCHFSCDFPATPPEQLCRFTQNWRHVAPTSTPEILWPRNPVYQQELIGNPAAFFQRGSVFAALVSDLEEGECGELGLQVNISDQLGFDYGVMAAGGHPLDLGSAFRFAYHICLDTQAQEYYGYQQVVRMLGNHDALKVVSVGEYQPTTDPMPALPLVAENPRWIPFTLEGTPLEIAALTYKYFLQAKAQDWEALEAGVRWLDRLCYHQHLDEAPGIAPFGSVGNGPQWDAVAHWLPQLLLEAFRLTGIVEYAQRAIAAIGALSPCQRSVVLDRLHPQFGDIYINADHGEALLLTNLDKFQPIMTTEGIDLTIGRPQAATPLCLMVDGSQASYTLVINGESLGVLPAEQLREGIELPVA